MVASVCELMMRCLNRHLQNILHLSGSTMIPFIRFRKLFRSWQNTGTMSFSVRLISFHYLRAVFLDTNLVSQAEALLNKRPDSTRFYSLDIMVTPRGTAITEVHNFMSLYLYSVDWDDALLYVFKDGID